MNQGAAFLPTDWLRASNARGEMTLKKVQRGHYQDGTNTIAISGSGRSVASVSLHELGHRTEATFADILDAQAQFYARRTQGESTSWLGSGFGRDEITRTDKFTNPYMGKDYSKLARRADAYELLSMGLEGVFFGKYDLLEGDPEMWDFVVGLLMSAGKL